MIRNTLLGLAAASALALTASAASAGGYGYHYNSYYAPSYTYNHYQPTYVCKKIIVGYKTVYGYYGYQQVPVFKKVCSYSY